MTTALTRDDEQERLRRDLAHWGIYYIYKAEAADGVIDDTRIRADEAAHALALFHPAPRNVVWLKNEPALHSNPDRLYLSSRTQSAFIAMSAPE